MSVDNRQRERTGSCADVCRGLGHAVLVALGLCGLSGIAAAQGSPEAIYNSGAFPSSLAAAESDADPTGALETIRPNGGVAKLKDSPFFQALGKNGRSCATCHQPPSGMSVSTANIKARFQATGGADPIFDPIDGANCPDATGPNAHSLLLNQGLIRIPITVPSTAEFTVAVVSDPTGCNLKSAYNQTVDPKTGQTLQVVSVFRRPLPATNLPFVTVSDTVPPNTEPKPFAIMWDGREHSLGQQAIDATLGHAQATAAPTATQIHDIVAFESDLFSAQSENTAAGNLTAGGVTGGPATLSTTTPGQSPKSSVTFAQYAAWKKQPSTTMQASIFRGEQIFDARNLNLFNVSGITTKPNVPIRWTCSRCHSQEGSGNDPNGTLGLLGLGIGGSQTAFGGPPTSTSLPIFQLTCKGNSSTQYQGKQITTNDPGAGLITGLCKDLEKFKTSTVRGLAARAPYFHDGTADTLTDVVNVYNKRFNMSLSSQDVQDLVNFMNAL